MSIKASELTNVTTLATSDRLIAVTPSSNAGSSITYEDLAALVLETYDGSTLFGDDQSVEDAFSAVLALLQVNNTIATHNRSRGGKYLGSSYTSDQKAMITARTYDDLYVEDYWTINGVNYRIAEIEPFRQCGSTSIGAHICIVPDTILVANSSSFPVYMNSSNDTTGGYLNSYMHQTVIPACDTIVESAFGSANILSHTEYLSNAVSSGAPSAGEWSSCECCLMCEHMVYGGSVNGLKSSPYGLFNVGIGKKQLALFAQNANYINIRASYWLRDVVSASLFADVYNGGNANSAGASYTIGARPFFLLN